MLILAAAQALFQTTSMMVMTIAALAASRIADSASWATFPVATMFLGTAGFMFPASIWMIRVGRRTGFLWGTLLGATGGLSSAAGVAFNSMALLAAGTFLVGANQAFAQFYRFAAGEVADEAYKPKAISFVLAGGVVAALLGPSLARISGPIFEPEYLGSFLFLAAVALFAFSILLGLRMPPSEKMTDSFDHAAARPWCGLSCSRRTSSLSSPLPVTEL